ncbi:hypothetical protein AB0M57_04430 [Streptomyces sp. NPDC051597]|uniref:hypothetical protein n=1 Tax=Streptomyces sp. NPDC051597 TaxID=3155049 RepID=UPI00341EC281
MTALDRLLAEAIPDGTFGDAVPARRRRMPPPPWTADEQAAHYRELAEALGVSPLRVVEERAA